jgi:exosortase/archaeosortase family protein
MRYIIYFIALIMSFHYIYKFWAGNLDFYPLKAQVDSLFNYASLLLFNQSEWVLSNILNIDYTSDIDSQTFFVTSNSGQACFVEVSPGCTSLKQWMHWLFLMIIFPGPWKHKLWYIPAGLVVIQFINVVRIVGLSISLTYYPDKFHFFHDYIFKTFFYFMIFVMWLVWVEVFVERRAKGREHRAGREE